MGHAIRDQQLSGPPSLKAVVHDVLNVDGPHDKVGIAFSRFSILLVIFSSTAVILDTVDSIQRSWGHLLDGLQAGTTYAFAIEYILRIWSCNAEPRYAHPVFGRIRHALTPLRPVDDEKSNG